MCSFFPVYEEERMTTSMSSDAFFNYKKDTIAKRKQNPKSTKKILTYFESYTFMSFVA